MKKTTKPVPTGEYAVGTFTYTVYNDRQEMLREHENEMRSVAARVFQPAPSHAVEGMDKERYMTRDLAKAIRKDFFAPINYDKLEANGENTMECFRNAPHVENRRFPLIVFNHGYNSYREGNSFLCIELASHGYVVISVTHSHEALLTVLDDGTTFSFEKRIQKWMYNEPVFKVVKDMKRLQKLKGSFEEKAAAIDEWQKRACGFLNNRVTEWEKDVAAAVNYAKENFADFIDFNYGIGVSGHSMGGAVAYALCQDHPEYVGGVNIDGALFGNHDGKIMTKPYLQINCESNKEIIYRGFVNKDAPAYRIVFDGMQHMAFSDLKQAIPINLIAGKMDPDYMHENLCKIHLEFFDTFLKHKKEKPEFTETDQITLDCF